MTDRPVPQKSADAYRTISEVAEELKLPQHVLRFWETRFPQVKPLKRAGGRRFYRPEDVALLRAVQALLYGEGYTIKGVQRLLADFGARHVADALARSTASPAPMPAGGGQDDPDREARGVGAMSNDDQSGRGDPAGEMSRLAVAPPSRARPAFSPARAVEDAPLADRLNEVLADLAECSRLLSSARST